MDSQLIADQKVEAVNRITREAFKCLPILESVIEDTGLDFDKAEWIAERLAHDFEVETEIKNLLRIIIEEKTLLDQK